MNSDLIEQVPEQLIELLDKLNFSETDRPKLAALCATVLQLENSWNFGVKNPSVFLERCFSGENDQPFYARHKNPEGEQLEKIFADMHNCKFGLATVCGEAAISLVTQSLTKAGDTILVSEKLFGTSKNNFKLSANQDGRNIKFLPLDDLDLWQSSVKQLKPKMVFLESPSNPLAELADIEALSDITSNNDALLVVDSTYAPADIYQPLDLGADIVIESATKFIDGQTRVTGGLISTQNKNIWESLFKVRNAKGYNQVGFNALSLTYNARSLKDRVLKQSEHAALIAKEICKDPNIEQVYYLGLPKHPQHALASRVLHGGYGSMLAFTVKGSLEETQRIADATGFQVRANLGSINTIITHPMTSTHSRARLSEDEIISAGVTPNLLRLSVGLEQPEYLLKQITAALSILGQ